METDIRALSRQDACDVLAFIQNSLTCSGVEELRGLIEKLKCIVPFDYAVCALGRFGHGRQTQALSIVNVSYSTEWLREYESQRYQDIDPIVIENIKHFRLQWWADTYRKYLPPRAFLAGAEAVGLSRGYSHGIRNYIGDEGSIFSFAGRSVDRSGRSETILNSVVPHLHQALCRTTRLGSQKRSVALTTREREVLAWLSAGKTAWEISIILKISERTVNFHVQNIMQKLNASSRTHAVAIAVEEGVADPA